MRLHRYLVAGTLAALALSGCGSTARRPHSEPGAGGSDSGVGGSDTGVAGDPGVDACNAPTAGLIRLSFPELVVSLRELLGEELGDAAALELQLDDSRRTFPPLGSPDEGDVINDQRFEQSDRLAQLAAGHVREHFADVTGCAANDGFECVRAFVADLGERAFRRPLSDAEEQSLLLTVERAEALGVSTDYAAEFGAYAVFESPHFLYRTEFGSGDDGSGESPLTEHELASALAYFVTGGPPDAPLLEAAEQGTLSDEATLSAQIERLLDGPLATQQLQRILESYFRVDAVRTVILDPAVYPSWSVGVRIAATLELQSLMAQTVASGPAAGVLTNRSAHINADLAALYGVTFPPAGAALDENGFARVELPEARAGVLMRTGWSAATSTPEGPSLMGRAINVRNLMWCGELLPLEEHPLDLGDQSGSHSERARRRLQDHKCSGCHAELDPLGLALEDLDALAQFRSQYPDGQAVDASASLPAFVGGANVDGAFELSQALPAEVFASCLSVRLLEGALSWSGRTNLRGECWREQLAAPGDASARELVRRAVRSRAFSWRTR